LRLRPIILVRRLATFVTFLFFINFPPFLFRCTLRFVAVILVFFLGALVFPSKYIILAAVVGFRRFVHLDLLHAAQPQVILFVVRK